MKLRMGFVSNSSSSSFVIRKKYLEEDEISKIKEYLTNENEDGWQWNDNEDTFDGFTIMNNDYFEEFLRKLNVRMRAVEITEG